MKGKRSYLAELSQFTQETQGLYKLEIPGCTLPERIYILCN